MSKLINKTFYISDDHLLFLQGKYPYKIDEDVKHLPFALYIKDEVFGITRNQIQISWQEPDREITLTESQLEEIRNDWLSNDQPEDNFHDFLTRKLFGASDE